MCVFVKILALIGTNNLLNQKIFNPFQIGNREFFAEDNIFFGRSNGHKISFGGRIERDIHAVNIFFENLVMFGGEEKIFVRMHDFIFFQNQFFFSEQNKN